MKHITGYSFLPDDGKRHWQRFGELVEFYSDVVAQKKVPRPRIAHIGHGNFVVEGTPYIHTVNAPQKWEEVRVGVLILEHKEPLILWRAPHKAKSKAEADALAVEQAQRVLMSDPSTIHGEGVTDGR